MTDRPFTPADLCLAAHVDRPLVWTSGDSVRFLAVDVTAPTVEQERAPRAPLDLALVIDASGSMAGASIDAAKRAAAGVVERLGADDVLSVVSFDSQVTTHLDGRRMDAKGRAAALRAIAGLEAGSSTNLSGGWLRGCECVAAVMEKRPGLRNWVVVLSDGMANVGIQDPQVLAAHARELRLRGLLTSAVGVGERYSDTQLEAIATAGGGRLHHAADAGDILELVLGELEEARATVVERCELVLDLPRGLRAEVVGDYATAPRTRGLACTLGSLASGATRTAVFKLTCGEAESGAEVELGVAATWTPAGGDEPLETKADPCRLAFASSEKCKKQPVDRGLALRIAEAWQLWIVRRATLLNQEGELERAERFVARERKWLTRYCADLPGAELLLEAIARLARSVGRARYERRAAKEMLIASNKRLRSEREHRSHVESDWKTHLPT